MALGFWGIPELRVVRVCFFVVAGVGAEGKGRGGGGAWGLGSVQWWSIPSPILLAARRRHCALCCWRRGRAGVDIVLIQKPK